MADYDAFENRKSSQRGLTLVELIVAFTLLLILSTIALPLAGVQVKRAQERELRRILREMRTAIDRYKEASDRGLLQVELDSEGYPPDLETLVDGVDVVDDLFVDGQFGGRLDIRGLDGVQFEEAFT
ncbi:MAG: type II secretion system protein [Acidobacteria bacterium]|nr:type II secretion system protein [Acidobacteriota bacterium]